jgi:hypothetical protein
MRRGYTSDYICKCGGEVRITCLENHYVCDICNEDYGTVYDLSVLKLKKKEINKRRKKVI